MLFFYYSPLTIQYFLTIYDINVYAFNSYVLYAGKQALKEKFPNDSKQGDDFPREKFIPFLLTFFLRHFYGEKKRGKLFQHSNGPYVFWLNNKVVSS